MLKDITLGQYFPGDTFVHRLDPRTKLLAVILYIVALFNAKTVITYGIVILCLALCVAVSKVSFRALTRGLKPVYIIVAFTAIMNMFFTKGTPVADVWLVRHITWEGIIVKMADELLDSPEAYAKMAKAVNPYGDGHACERIAQAIEWYFGQRGERPAARSHRDGCALRR